MKSEIDKIKVNLKNGTVISMPRDLIMIMRDINDVCLVADSDLTKTPMDMGKEISLDEFSRLREIITTFGNPKTR